MNKPSNTYNQPISKTANLIPSAQNNDFGEYINFDSYNYTKVTNTVNMNVIPDHIIKSNNVNNVNVNVNYKNNQIINNNPN